MRTRGLKPKLLSALIGALAASGAMAQNLPVLSAVVSGSATTSVAGSTLTVNNSASAILNWSKFSIASGFTTNFVQPSAASSVLNRVVGADPSSILGSLISNGKVFLINPNGIVFGQGSQVNVGGLVASTAPLSNVDFLAGNLASGYPSATGTIHLSGSITAVDSIGIEALHINMTSSGSMLVTSPTGTLTLGTLNWQPPAFTVPALPAGWICACQTIVATPPLVTFTTQPLFATVSLNPTGSGAVNLAGVAGTSSPSPGIVLANTAGINPTGSGAITVNVLAGTSGTNPGNVSANTAGINPTGSGAITLTASAGTGSPSPGIVVANTAGLPASSHGKPALFQPASGNASGVRSAVQQMALISTTSTPGVQFVVPVLPTGTLGTAINSQGQISLLGNQAVIGGQPVAVTASVGPDGMVRLTAKP